ncbi:MAG: damage-control phosphatase ARMT1 family protein, partial [Halanaerobiales bacterium]
MNIKLECLNCLFKQVLEASRMVTDNNQKIKKVLDEYAKKIPEISLKETAPSISQKIHNLIKEQLQVEDPYREFKNRHIMLAKKVYPLAEKYINKSSEPIKNALIISATGNSIDSGINLNIDIKKAFKQGVNRGFAFSNYSIFKNKLKNASNLLIIGDNCGEAVLDKLLIKKIKSLYNLKVIYAVRSHPILNDITLKEAREIKINEICDVIESGSKAPGTILNQTTSEFQKVFFNSDI